MTNKMMKYILFMTTMLMLSISAERLKKVPNCVCYCPVEELNQCSDCGKKHEEIQIDPGFELLNRPGFIIRENAIQNAKNIDNTAHNFPKNNKFTTHYHSKNSSSTSSSKTHRQTKKKIIKKHFTKKQIAMIHRAGQKLIQRYQKSNRFGHRNMGESTCHE